MDKIFLHSKDDFLKRVLESDLLDENIEIEKFNVEEHAKKAKVLVVDVKKKEDLEAIRMARERNGRVIILAVIPYKNLKLKEEILSAGADEVMNFPLDEDEMKILFPMLLASYALGDPYRNGRISDFLEQVNKTVNLFRKNERLGITLLEKLQKMASFRDNDTAQHTQRVGRVAQLLAESLELPPQKVINIRLTAPLHDIGKIGIPDTILLKNGALNDEEWEIMKKHTIIGGDILKSDIEILVCAKNIALYHHERYDGIGYPFQLKGEDIPIEARITTVADSFDAIVSARPYKPPHSYEEGIRELQKGSGSQFDPKIVNAFIKVSKSIFLLYDRLKPV